MTRDQRIALAAVGELARDAKREAHFCANGEWNEPVKKLGDAVDQLCDLVRELLGDE